MILLNVEVQAQRDPGLGLRMYRYHYRIHDLYDRFPISLVVLADEELGWRPGPFVHEAGRRGLARVGLGRDRMLKATRVW
jgi:hypothetical protein